MAHPARAMPVRTSTPGRIAFRATQLCVALVPLTILPGINEFTLLPKLLVLQIALLVIAIAWAYRPDSVPFRAIPAQLPIFFLFLMLSASAFWAANHFRSTFDLSKHLSFLLFLLLLFHNLSSNRIIDILRVSTISGAVVSILGIGEYLGFLPDLLPSTGRPSSTFGFRNLAAQYLVANLPLSLLYFIRAHREIDRVVAGVSSALMFVFLLYTRARGSWVGLFAATFLHLALLLIFARHLLFEFGKVLFNRRVLKVAGVALLLIGLLAPLPEGFRERHLQRFDEKKIDVVSTASSIFKRGGDRGRLLMWQRTLRMVRDAPLLGVGLGNWAYVFPLYTKGGGEGMVGAGHNPLRPHNDLLWIWSEAGTPALLAYLALIGTVLLLAVRIWRKSTDPHACISALCYSLTVWSVVGASCFGFPWERIPASMLFWLATASVGILARETGVFPSPEYAPSRITRWTCLLIPILLLASIWITLRRIGFDYYHVTATIAFAKKDHSAKVREAAHAIAFGPFDHQIFIIHGDGNLALGNFDAAERSFKRCLDYHPNFGNAYNNLGLLWDRKEENEKAIFYFRKALDLVPNHHIARYNLGTVFQKLGQFDSAKVAYRESFQPHHTVPYVNLGGIYRSLGDTDSAIVVYREALAGSVPSNEAYFNLGNIYAEQRRYEEAAEAYSNFLSVWKGDPEFLETAREGLSEANSGMGVQAEQRGENDRAIEYHQNAIRYWPENAQNWFNLGNTYRKEEAWDKAEKAYHRSLARDSTYVDAYNNLGLTYRDLGDNDKAIQTFKKGLRQGPDQPVLHYNIGNAYTDIGDTLSALEAYDAFRRNWKGDTARLHYYLGNAYLEMDNTLGALEEYRAFLKNWQGSRAEAEAIEALVRKLEKP